MCIYINKIMYIYRKLPLISFGIMPKVPLTAGCRKTINFLLKETFNKGYYITICWKLLKLYIIYILIIIKILQWTISRYYLKYPQRLKVIHHNMVENIVHISHKGFLIIRNVLKDININEFLFTNYDRSCWHGFR